VVDEQSLKVVAFLDEIEAACRKHGLSIGHEDAHGGFIIATFSDRLLGWLRAASDDTGAK
jgi:hypothetical protein